MGSKNKFEYSEEYNCWFGWTQKGEKFAFDGDEKIIEIIKNNTWYVNDNKILCAKLKKTLREVVYGEKEKKSNVISNRKNELNLLDKFYDNRKINLEEISRAENNKNIRSKDGKLTGMNKMGDKWLNTFTYNDNGVRFQVHTPSKTFEECYIDNLIVQRYLKYKHNEDLFYKLDSVPNSRILEIEELIKNKIIKGIEKHSNKSSKVYAYDMLDCGDFYIVKLKNGEFKISKDEQSLNILKRWNCNITRNASKKYISCNNNKDSTIRLHRLLMGLTEDKYNTWYIDHLNGDGLDNRLENMIITDAFGNSINRKHIGYKKCKKNNKYKVTYMSDYLKNNLPNYNEKDYIFYSEEEAIECVNNIKRYILENRLSFKNREELDEYINNNTIK